MDAVASLEGSGTVRKALADGVGILTLDYPRRRNALSLDLREVLHDRLAELVADPECRVIVLTGAAGCFCSGGDISTMEGVTPVSGRKRLQRIHRVIRLLWTCEKPVIAAVEGWSAGAGTALAAACDIIVAARDARFACNFAKIGLMPDLGAAFTLVQRLGAGRAKYLMMAGQEFDGAAAEKLGLVDVVAEPGEALATAQALAANMATLAPLSLGMTKALVARMPASFEDMLAAEVDAQGVLFASEDFAEGRAAFMAKRTPRFQAR